MFRNLKERVTISEQHMGKSQEKQVIIKISNQVISSNYKN